MKYLLAVFIGLTAQAAYSQQGITNTHEVALSTQTLVQTVALNWNRTTMGTAISSGNVAGYFGIEVYNTANSGSTIVCGFDVSLSTDIASVWYGREIAAGVGLYYAVPSYRPLYCRNKKAAGATDPVTVTLFK